MVPKVGKVTVGVGSAVGLMLLILTYFEGSKPVAYYDPVGIPTVCIGHTDPTVVVGEKKSAQECLDLLSSDLQIAWHIVSSTVKVPLQPWEQMAYASFVFNMGKTKWLTSSMLREVNLGHHEKACYALLLWNKATVEVWDEKLKKKVPKKIPLPGLVKRREFEKELCLGHDVKLGN